MVPLAGASTSFAGAPAVTVSEAEAPVSPAAFTVMVAVPTVVGVKLEAALPPVGVTGEVGVKLPDTPLTVKLIGVVADVTVLPLASWMLAT